MEKTFEQLEDEIVDEFTGGSYEGCADAEEILTKICGQKVSWYDTKIDDGIDDDEDYYVMAACFTTEDRKIDIIIYYGNVTSVIGYVQVRKY